MRLYPTAAGGTLRQLKKDINLGGYDLLAGTSIGIHFYSIHRNPDYWDRPTDFLPVSLRVWSKSGRKQALKTII